MSENLNFDISNEVNKIKVDRYGRVKAFLAINKPVGVTSHDVVDMVRRAVGIRKVGHAGALDPFAAGVLLVLVGKEYTVLADEFIGLDKAYKAKLVLGMKSETLDYEGERLEQVSTGEVSKEALLQAISKFEGGYEQQVPVFSSVKVDGDKLRVLARSSENFEIFEENGKIFAKFINYQKKNKKKRRKKPNPEGESQQLANSKTPEEIKTGKTLIVEIPRKPVVTSNFEVTSFGELSQDELEKYLKMGQDSRENRFDFDGNSKINFEYNANSPLYSTEFVVDCSKGTYIRQLGQDIAKEMQTEGMLVKLVRNRIGDYKLENTITIEELQQKCRELGLSR